MAAELGYEHALGATRTYGLLGEEALAFDVAARSTTRGACVSTRRPFVPTRAPATNVGGAYGKVRSLDREHLGLTPATSLHGSIRQLDVATVLEISHAVSSEIVHERLVERLLAIAVEHAGAVSGRLVTPTPRRFSQRGRGARRRARDLRATRAIAS